MGRKYERVSEWIELTEEGVTLDVVAAGSDEFVDELTAAAAGRYELKIEWRDGSVKLTLSRRAKRARLEVAVAMKDRPWFLVRDELVKLVEELGCEEVLRRIVDELYSAVIDP